MSSGRMQKSVVFTALFGGYEELNDAQNVGNGDVPFICFTDDESLSSSVWQIRLIEPLFVQDLQRSQRAIKIRGCDELKTFDRSLYIDNSVSLKVPPAVILDEWLADHDVAIPAHSFRKTVLDEFLAVIDLRLDEPARVYEQLDHYSEIARDVLDDTPLWNAMIARRNLPAVNQAMDRWFDEVLRYSRRDQLSANRILIRDSITVNRVAIDNHHSPVHEWSVPSSRRPSAPWRVTGHTVPDFARVRELEKFLAEEHESRERESKEFARFRSSRAWRLASGLSQARSAFSRIRRSR